MVEKRDDGEANATPGIGKYKSSYIKVSVEKNPDFYVSLGKKLLEKQKYIELHALGNAIEISVIASENLVRNNYATFQEIRTETITVQSSNDSGDSKNAKLFITLKRSPNFFENMEKLNKMQEEQLIVSSNKMVESS